MVSRRLALLLVAAFAIVFNFLLPQFASGQIPRPPSLQEMTQPKRNRARRKHWPGPRPNSSPQPRSASTVTMWEFRSIEMASRSIYSLTSTN